MRNKKPHSNLIYRLTCVSTVVLAATVAACLLVYCYPALPGQTAAACADAAQTCGRWIESSRTAAIEWYEKTLLIDPNYESALNNLSRCYLFQAQEYAAAQSSVKVTDKKKLAKDKEILNGYYKKALPLLERLRETQPEKYDLWLANLTNCYYNLNMTAKLKEMEALEKSLGY